MPLNSDTIFYSSSLDSQIPQSIENFSSTSSATASILILESPNLSILTSQQTIKLIQESETVEVEGDKYSRIENRKTERHPDSNAQIPMPNIVVRFLYFTLLRSPKTKEELITGMGLKTPEKINELTGKLSILKNIDNVIDLNEQGQYFICDQENFRDCDFWGFQFRDQI